ncbi:hypothetical protein EVAR_43898_1 [Eumeta japonica]|uniref:Uncharacterized protein n=1 Tax=Eumeta variegata TaxID=151549 RepID=A0A4C1WRG5_EUMVA|nr:hypothetical protein EVAR_43898_1 [Eumeta japonica]
MFETDPSSIPARDRDREQRRNQDQPYLNSDLAIRPGTDQVSRERKKPGYFNLGEQKSTRSLLGAWHPDEGQQATAGDQVVEKDALQRAGLRTTDSHNNFATFFAQYG